VNLANTNTVFTCFDSANLTGVNFTNANVQVAQFQSTTSRGFTAAQLYSTANYQAKDLEGIDLEVNNLSSWNFSGQDLSGARFGGSSLQSANLTNANLTGTDLINWYSPPPEAWYIPWPTDLTGADTRGATGLNLNGVTSTQNLIMPDGSINGLDLSTGFTLVVRNYTSDANGNPAHIPIKIHTGMNMGTNGTMQVVLDGNAWGSTISFDAGIPVTLGGTLDVTFAPGVTPVLGMSVKLFDWTGVTPTGTFQWQDDLLKTAYSWNISHLYDTGTVTIFSRGDTNQDGVLNSLDIDAIYQHFSVAPSAYPGTWPRPIVAYNSQYDVNGDGVVDQHDVTYELNYYFHTGYGDANLDRSTDFVDFQALLTHWQQSGPGIGWAQADFNGDGSVDFLDFQDLLNYWVPGGWNFAPSQVPEPASLSLLALGALALLRRSRK
jgi:uncharacterized protein YjbI with pentapeptide repeats